MTLSSTVEIWSDFQHRIRQFLRGRVKADDVEDVLQDVFVRIHRSLQRGEVPRDPVAWVFQIARTTVIDHYRRCGTDQAEPHPSPADLGVQFPFELDNPAREELSRCVRSFIEQLSPPYQEALVLTALEGVSQVEAARRAGISVSGMKSRVQRGRRQLAADLLRCCDVQFDRRGRPIDPGGDCSSC